MNVPSTVPVVLIAVIVLAATTCGGATTQPAPSPETPEVFLQRIKPILDHDDFVSKTDGELSEIILPKVEFREASVKGVIAEMNKLILSHNSKPTAFQIPPLRIRDFNLLGLLEHATTALPGASPEQSNGSNVSSSPAAKSVAPEDAPLTLSLSNVSLKELLRYVTGLSGMVIDIEQDAIWLKPLSSGESLLLKRVYIVPEAVISTKAQAGKFLKPIIPQFASPDFFWDFDGRSHQLTLQFANPTIEEFEKLYARELLKHGFRVPPAQSILNWQRVRELNPYTSLERAVS